MRLEHVSTYVCFQVFFRSLLDTAAQYKAYTISVLLLLVKLIFSIQLEKNL